MSFLEARGLTKRYPRTTDLFGFLRHPLRRETTPALDGVDLSLDPGRVYGLVGANGAGKTTLLKILAGLVLPTSGSLTVEGRDATEAPRWLRERVGFVVADERSFFWRISVRENLRFFATLQGLPQDGLRRRLDEHLERFGLSDRADTAFRELSTGLRQRLAIARGLLADPPILLLDEATRSLDPESAARVRALVGRLARQSPPRVVVYSTHVLSEVDELCDEVLIMRAGRIVGRAPVGRVRDGSRFRIRARTPLDAELFADIPGANVCRDDSRRVELTSAGQLDAVVDRLRARGIGIDEVRPLAAELEELLPDGERGALA